MTFNKFKGVYGMDAGGGVTALLTSAASGMTSEINAALPIAGPIFAVIAGIFIGLKIFKKVTGAKV